MCSPFIFRTCLNPLKPFIHQRGSAFFTVNTSLCKSSKLPASARSLSTRDTDGPSDRRGSGQGAVRGGSVRRREHELWDDAGTGRGKSSTLRQRPAFTTSVFAAGTAKRTAEMLRRKAPLVSEDEEYPKDRKTRGAERTPPPDQPLSAAEWRKLKESQGNHPRFEIQMMSTLFASRAKLDIAKSLLTFVAMETGTLSYELLLRYLTLCVAGGHDAEVFDIYDIMRGSFPALDTGASSLFIKAFSRTARWREAISILHDVKKACTPSPRSYGDIISAAMLYGDVTTAWALYDEIFEMGLSPFQETWDVLFKGPRKTREEKGTEAETVSPSEHRERLLEILLFMRTNQIYPQQSLASSIRTWFERGVCRCCGSELESIHLTAEEYQQLKDRVMTDIIQGRDIFNKTTPEELESFKAFVKRKPAFDVVVDGLNVANINKDRGRLSETLLTVVSELHRQGLTVLVLGRKHMLRPSRSWERHSMDLIQKKAHCFFTENISEDDPFLLYATLHSGNHCRFVSQDLMRDHKACLPDGATRRLFFKWQRGHQLVVHGRVVAGKRVQFQVRMKRGGAYERRGDLTEDEEGNIALVFPAMTPLSRLQATHGTFPMTTQRTGVPMKYLNNGSASPKSTEHTHIYQPYALILT
ncbi:hypothetical protein L3Q82_026762 [Scortum barcoo]|uniref:Uncharacterized protein n=1 Tax=Scortum barcoo TaxID=214431 RepID=A0ACB8WJA0_9TELE|nr:hypothetical protein L3Q82_026762 [Scortum barcoo]